MLKKIKGLALVMVAFSLVACGASGGGAGIPGSDSNKVLATVNGQNITEGEVLKEIEPQLKKIQTEIYKMEKSGLNQMIDGILLEQAAKKEGLSKEKYLENYISKNSKEPTEEEIKRYYEFRKKQMGDKKFDDVKNQIVQFLKSNQKNALQRKLMKQLKTSAKVEIKLEAPKIDLKIGKSPKKGAKSGKVEIIEFTDYQCPFCKRARPTITKILETYPNDVTYSLKDFPLSFHKDAQKAHEAGHCAAEQGKYWEMSDELFANQRALKVADLKKYAKKIGLDMKKYNKCMDESAYADKVKDGIKEGAGVGVTGTPAFFVNGIMISGARPFADFKEIIDQELQN